MPILKVPLGNASVEGAGIQQKMVNIGLLVFPELGRGVLTQRIDEAVRDCSKDSGSCVSSPRPV